MSMIEFHLARPAKKDFWSLDELRCLARCLGFMDNLFEHQLPPDTLSLALSAKGLDQQVLESLLNRHTFDSVLHRTSNMRSADYNRMVILKAIKLLLARKTTFHHLSGGRKAFDMFEANDLEGISTDLSTLQQALKACGLVTAPTRIMVQVRLLQRVGLHRNGRLQLWEFFDLLPLCVGFDEVCQKCPSATGGKSSDNEELYELADFQSIFMTVDERTAQHLDSAFKKSHSSPTQKQEAMPGLGRYSPVGLPAAVLRADRIKRVRMLAHVTNSWKSKVALDREGARELQQKVAHSKDSLCLARAGFHSEDFHQMLLKEKDRMTGDHYGSHLFSTKADECTQLPSQGCIATAGVSPPEKKLLPSLQNEVQQPALTKADTATDTDEDHRLPRIITDKEIADHQARIDSFKWDNLMKARSLRRRHKVERQSEVVMAFGNFTTYSAAKERAKAFGKLCEERSELPRS